MENKCMNFFIEEFAFRRSYIGVHCKTEEESNNFCKSHEKYLQGIVDYSEYDWNKYKDKTCYCSNGMILNIDKDKKYMNKIVEWSDYMD